MKRIFLIVLDSFGIGAMPDSEAFGDVGVNTLASCAKSEKLHIPNMIAAGLGNIQRVDVLPFHQMGRYKWQNLGLDYTLADTEPPEPELTDRVRAIFRTHGFAECTY